MRVLFLSTLFPDAGRPTYGIHNASLVRRLAEVLEVSVVSPRPRLSAWLTRPGLSVAAPCPEDSRLAPLFPAVPYVPRLGSAVNHRLYATWLAPAVRRVCRERQPQIVLAAWVYPDGCAALRLAGVLGLPGVVIAQGTDVNDYLEYPLRRRVILGHLRQAGAVICRSAALRQRLVEAGVPAERVATIYNGVDTEFFRPAADRATVRQQLGLPPDACVVLFVGNLVRVKDPVGAVRATALLAARPGGVRCRLVMLGDGPLRSEVQAVSRECLGEAGMVLGARGQAEVARYMQAADVLCVPSRNEGVPNAIREALASGLPVAATRVGGIPEVLTDPHLCDLVEPGDPAAMAQALARVLARGPLAAACRQRALDFSWEATIQAYRQTLARVAPEAEPGHPG